MDEYDNKLDNLITTIYNLINDIRDNELIPPYMKLFIFSHICDNLKIAKKI